MSESLATAAGAPVVYGEKSYPVPTMRDFAGFQASIPGLTAKERSTFGMFEVLDWLESFQGLACLAEWYKADHKVEMPENAIDARLLVKEITDRFLALNRLPVKTEQA
jgi:hypothetical protein